MVGGNNKVYCSINFSSGEFYLNKPEREAKSNKEFPFSFHRSIYYAFRFFRKGGGVRKPHTAIFCWIFDLKRVIFHFPLYIMNRTLWTNSILHLWKACSNSARLYEPLWPSVIQTFSPSVDSCKSARKFLYLTYYLLKFFCTALYKMSVLHFNKYV